MCGALNRNKNKKNVKMKTNNRSWMKSHQPRFPFQIPDFVLTYKWCFRKLLDVLVEFNSTKNRRKCSKSLHWMGSQWVLSECRKHHELSEKTWSHRKTRNWCWDCLPFQLQQAWIQSRDHKRTTPVKVWNISTLWCLRRRLIMSSSDPNKPITRCPQWNWYLHF